MKAASPRDFRAERGGMQVLWAVLAASALWFALFRGAALGFGAVPRWPLELGGPLVLGGLSFAAKSWPTHRAVRIVALVVVLAGITWAALETGGASSPVLVLLGLIVALAATMFGEPALVLAALGAVISVGATRALSEPAPPSTFLLPLACLALGGTCGLIMHRHFRAVLKDVNAQQIDSQRNAGLLATEVKLRRHAQEQLDTAYRAAIDAGRAKSTFLANMSHELRTPMNAVVGLTDLMLRDTLLPAHRENLETVKESSRGLLLLLDDLLDLSKIEAGAMRLEVVNFATRGVIQQLERLHGPRASAKGVSFEVQVTASVPQVLKGDPLRLTQVLNNLVSNALKFTERGGVTVALDYAGGKLSVQVTDTGIGMTPEQASRLFKPFEQADQSTTRRFGGTGLGLAIVKRLCEQQDGEITAKGEPGQGSVFTALMAIGAGDGPVVIDVGVPHAVRPLTGLKVLVAEDNIINQRVATRLLERLSVQASLVSNGLEACAAVEAERWDVVLMDLQMPELDGFEATRRIRSRGGPQPYIIALSANAMAEDRLAALEAGADAFLPKPITLDALALGLHQCRQLKASESPEAAT